MIAPTGTIGLVMDCDTTGIEPDFALVKFKKLAGGGYFKIVNQSVPEALARLGYAPGADRGDRRATAVGHGTLAGAPHDQPRRRCSAKGFTEAQLDEDRGGAARRFDLTFAFNRWTLGDEFCTRRARASPTSSSTTRPSTCSRTSASRKAEIDEANDYVCGT